MIWMVSVAIAAMLIYYFRKEIKKYLSREIKQNLERNYIDDEIEVYMAQYSGYSSEELARLSKSQTLSEKELYAVQKTLMQRQMFP